MINKTFRSDQSRDSVDISYFPKSHKSNFFLKQFDDFDEHIKLIGRVIKYLKENDIKWVCLEIDTDPKIPSNTVWFRHEKSGNVCCHIEDFEKFYLKNMESIIKINTVYVDPNPVTEDGWNMVVNPKKMKKEKLRSINQQIKALSMNWSTF